MQLLGHRLSRRSRCRRQHHGRCDGRSGWWDFIGVGCGRRCWLRSTPLSQSDRAACRGQREQRDDRDGCHHGERPCLRGEAGARIGGDVIDVPHVRSCRTAGKGQLRVMGRHDRNRQARVERVRDRVELGARSDEVQRFRLRSGRDRKRSSARLTGQRSHETRWSWSASIAPLGVSITDSEAESCPSMQTAVVRWSLARPISIAHARVASVSETDTTSWKPDSVNASRSDDNIAAGRDVNRVDGVAACGRDIADAAGGGSRRGGARIDDVEGVVVERIPCDVYIRRPEPNRYWSTSSTAPILFALAGSRPRRTDVAARSERPLDAEHSSGDLGWHPD